MIDQIKRLKVIPVITVEDSEKIQPLVDALCSGGVPCAEITLRTDTALESISKVSGRDDLLLGAGTVHSIEQAKAAADAGARFIVTPGFNPKTVSWCLDNQIPVFPGISSPTDLEMALDFGLSIVKFFPAEAIGGIKTLKAFAGPYGSMRFIPTGGIGPGNLADYLSIPQVIACGGSWMVKGNLLDEGRFDEIQRLTREAIELVS